MTVCVNFFFVKQQTAYEMRISDWSSDVCSSDLLYDVPMPGRDLLLELEHTLGVVADAGEGEHLVDVRDVLLADLRVVVLAVVRLVGEARSEDRRVGKECGST